MKINRIKKFIDKKIYFFGIFLMLIILVELGVLAKKSTSIQSANYSITLTENGFTPKKLNINQGDSITFTTNTDKSFWPASDIHPTHTIYSEFDPKEPIDPQKSWAFRFEKVGRWKYHDHLAPLFQGEIIVESKKVSKEVKSDSENSLETQQQWTEDVRRAARSGGVRGAFEVFDNLFRTEPKFAENCHSYTHIIGEEAYKIYVTGKNLDLTTQIAYCSYGFFHAFMESMLHYEGGLQKAREFCLKVDKEMSEDLYTLGPCFHGIGHGVADSTNKTIKGAKEVFDLVFEGLRLCKEVGQTEYEVKLCGTGVFNALAIMYLSAEQYGLTLNPQDPYQFCREQELSSYFREACYEDFKIIPMGLENNNFEKAARYVEEIKEDRYASAAMDTVSSFMAYYLLADSKLRNDALRTCYKLQKRLWGPCIAGLGAGFLGQSTPDEEYVLALEVCNSSLVQEKERVACFERVGRLINLRYPKQEARAICNTIDEKYQKYCE